MKQGNRLHIGKIAEYLHDNNLSRVEFCEKCKITEKELQQIFNFDYSFDVTVLFKIVKVLNIHINEIFF